MTEAPDRQSLVRLNRRAAHCRRLAEDAASEGIAAELRVIAQSYETEANEIERLTVAAPTDRQILPVDFHAAGK
jgi:hypothetical protein